MRCPKCGYRDSCCFSKGGTGKFARWGWVKRTAREDIRMRKERVDAAAARAARFELLDKRLPLIIERHKRMKK